MNVCLISHLFPTPTHPLRGTFVMEKAIALARQTPLTVCAPVAWAPLLRRRPPFKVTHHNLQVYHPAYPGAPSCMFAYRHKSYLVALRKFFRQIPRPDVLLLDWIYPDAYAVQEYCRDWKVPVIITAHGANAIGYYTHERRLPYFIRPLQTADHIIAVSKDLQRKIVAVAGVPVEKTTVIPNGVDPTIFRPLAQSAARVSLAFPADAPLIVSVARLAPEKALHLLLHAVSHLQNPNVQLRIIGNGPLRQRLLKLTRRLRLETQVQFLGEAPRARIAQWLAAADLFALSSLHEGDPVVIREALACGTPVVAPKVGGIPEIISEPRYGLLCEANDSLQLARALETALSASWDRAILTNYGQQHTWDDVATKVLALMQKAV